MNTSLLPLRLLIATEDDCEMLGTHNIREGIVDRSMFVDSHSRNSPFGFTSDDSLQNQPTTPNFLFGSANKRRSLAIPPSHSYQGIFSIFLHILFYLYEIVGLINISCSFSFFLLFIFIFLNSIFYVRSSFT